MSIASKTINIVTIGHVDHGKSTLIGRMLYESGAIKNEKLKDVEEAAKNLGKGKIDFAFLMDTFQEEREGGLTIDIMHTPFKSKERSYTFIDCPGHREFIKNMITGTSHADAALLVVSAKKGEGVENQTKEHTWLAKILGINQMIVVINKMDAVDYRKDVYEILSKEVKKLLESIGYDVNKIPFIPVSAIKGDNVYKKSKRMKWYNGDILIDVLDNTIYPIPEPLNFPLRIVVQDVYENQNVSKKIDANIEKIVVGRVETGVVNVGDELIFKPSNVCCKVSSIKTTSTQTDVARAGDSIGLLLEGNIDRVKRGDVASHKTNVTNVASSFIAQIYVMQPMNIRVGNILDIRCGTASADCKVTKIINLIDPRNGSVVGGSDVVSQNNAATVEFVSNEPIAIERYSDIPQLGRFVILDDGLTKACGIVIDLKKLI